MAKRVGQVEAMARTAQTVFKTAVNAVLKLIGRHFFHLLD